MTKTAEWRKSKAWHEPMHVTQEQNLICLAKVEGT